MTARAIKTVLLSEQKLTDEDKKRLIADFNEAVRVERAHRTDEDRKSVVDELKRYDSRVTHQHTFVWAIPETFTYTDIEEFCETALTWPFQIMAVTQPDLDHMHFCGRPFCGPGVQGTPKTILSPV